MTDSTESLKKQAEALARQETPAAEAVIALVKQLKKQDEFTPARELLDQVRHRLAADPLHTQLAQLHALCTYKDANLQADKRYRQALAILAEIGLGDPKCNDKETLGQGGAIYKRLWEATGQMAHLHTALAFYRAGWERDAENDLGWCGVNAAYLLDLLAFRERVAARRAGSESHQADEWQKQARALRQQMQKQLPSLLDTEQKRQDYWNLATQAEIHFGLANEYDQAGTFPARANEYDQAGKFLARASAVNKSNWEKYTTARQLVSLARLQGIEPPEAGQPREKWHAAWQALEKLLGDNTLAVLDSWRGKVGLALSGGGFRASLFHLGVLARLAECGVLRSVETLSTVSGGSILGAHYYLELRQLLRTKPDANLERQDYIDLVRRLMEASFAGIEKNLRVRVLTNLWANLKMAVFPGYSRSMRMGELYERHLFSRVEDEHTEYMPKGFGGLVCRLFHPQMRRLRSLRIFPAASLTAPTAQTGFKPRKDNWLRLVKVPNLMINTTSLNSGHNWHFTARWMGEPPGLTGDEIDMSNRYRRLYYDEAPTGKLHNYPLAYAVAASSCVPALFEPMPLHGLYPGHTVRLVDGGVHDNQGMAGLLDDECNFILCSDASGQMESQAEPANGMLGTFWRSDSIFQERLRQAQYRELSARAEAGALQGLFFIHLKQGLETSPIDWVDCKASHYQPPGSTCTDYGVDREIQGLLSAIRTDLDSFSEVEAYALMASGYLMTSHQLRKLDREYQASGQPGSWGNFQVNALKDTVDWPFTPIIPLMGLPPDSPDLRRRELVKQLKASKTMFFRVWSLFQPLRYLAYGAGLVGFAGGFCWLVQHWDETIALHWPSSFQVGLKAIALGLLLASTFVPLLKYLGIRRATQNSVLTLGASLFGFFASHLHLWVFDRLFKWQGRLKRLMQLKP
jgi:predicted acylesterase/phospholipase RssA